MSIELPERRVFAGDERYGRLAVRPGGEHGRAVAKGLGDLQKQADVFFKTELNKHLQSIKDSYQLKFYKMSQQRMRDLKKRTGGDVLGIGEKNYRPGMEAEYAKETTDGLRKDFEKELEGLNSVEREWATAALSAGLNDFNNGVNSYVSRETQRYQKEAYDGSLGTDAIFSAKNPNYSVDDPDNPGKRISKHEYWEKQAMDRIDKRARDLGWDVDKKRIEKQAWLDSAIPRQVLYLLERGDTGLAMEHLKKMKGKLSPGIYKQMHIKAEGADHLTQSQQLVDIALEKGHGESWIRKKASGKVEQLALRDFRQTKNAQRAEQKHRRDENERYLFLQALQVRNLISSGQGMTPEARAKLKEINEKRSGLDAKGDTFLEDILSGRTQKSNPFRVAELNSMPDKDFLNIDLNHELKTRQLSPEDYGVLLDRQNALGQGKRSAHRDAVAAGERTLNALFPRGPKRRKMRLRLNRFIDQWGKDFGDEKKKVPDSFEIEKYLKSQAEEFDIVGPWYDVSKWLDKEWGNVSPKEFDDTLDKVASSSGTEEAVGIIPVPIFEYAMKTFKKRKNRVPNDKELIEEAKRVVRLFRLGRRGA